MKICNIPKNIEHSKNREDNFHVTCNQQGNQMLQANKRITSSMRFLLIMYTFLKKFFKQNITTKAVFLTNEVRQIEYLQKRIRNIS